MIDMEPKATRKRKGSPLTEYVEESPTQSKRFAQTIQRSTSGLLLLYEEEIDILNFILKELMHDKGGQFAHSVNLIMRCSFLHNEIFRPIIHELGHRAHAEGRKRIHRFLNDLFAPKSWDDLFVCTSFQEGSDLSNQDQEGSDLSKQEYRTYITYRTRRGCDRSDCKERNRIIMSPFGNIKRMAFAFMKITDIPPSFTELFPHGANMDIDLKGNNIVNLALNIGNIGFINGKLDLSHNKITEVPPSMGNLTLEELQMSNNKLWKLPEEINRIVACCLDFGENEISSLPPSMGELTLLSQEHKRSTLNLERNYVKTIPDDFFPGMKVDCVILSYNAITAIPPTINQFGHGEALNQAEVDLSQNSISILPVEMGSLCLDKLNLDGNELTELPASLFVADIKQLCCQGNVLTRLPECPKPPGNTPRKPRKLDMSHNHLWTIPKTLLHLDLSHCDLKLDNNLITELPEIGDIFRIKSLNLSHNKLKKLPESIGNLQFVCDRSASHPTAGPYSVGLFLQANRLSTLPSSFGDMQFVCNEPEKLTKDVRMILQLGDNRLVSLPENVSKLGPFDKRADSFISLNENMLKVLPHDIGDLGRVDRFHIAFNFLRTVPPSFVSLEMDECMLSNNRIETLPLEIGSLNIKIFTLGCNALKSLPDSFAKLIRGDSLILLRENKLEKLPQTFTEIQEIGTLDLSRNNLNSLPNGLEYFKSRYVKQCGPS